MLIKRQSSDPIAFRVFKFGCPQKVPNQVALNVPFQGELGTDSLYEQHFNLMVSLNQSVM